MESIVNNLKRASVDMILLSLLTEDSMYGYQMAQEIKKRSNGELTVMEASMYPILNRLMENGDITSERVQVTPKLTRVYYTITDVGKQHLQERLDIFKNTVSVINRLTKCSEE